MSVKSLLTEGLDYSPLPLARLEPRLLLAVENALRIAWQRIHANETHKPILQGGGEDIVTALLEFELEDLRQTKAAAGLYHEEVFSMPSRGAEFINYDAKNIKKSPDFVFRIKAKRPGLSPRLSIFDGIFVECKLLTKSATVNDYIKNGVQRFVDGEYAWVMQEGLMMAYVRTSQSLPEALENYFIKNKKTNKYNLKSNLTPCGYSSEIPNVFTTTHGRTWKYPSGSTPGDINIRHLWLRVEV